MIYNLDNANLALGNIKEIISNFNLPSYKVYKDGDRMQEGRSYIYKNNIYRCMIDSKNNQPKLKLVGDYKYNKKILNITKSYNINSTSYDDSTHLYLGEYLRFIRDYNNINLMPLYNCILQKPADNLNLIINYSTNEGKDLSHTFINTDDNNYYYIVASAKFDKNYTIAIDCQSSYDIFATILNNNVESKEYTDLINSTYCKIPGSLFRTPFLYSSLVDIESDLYSKLWKLENDLRLIIKLPKTCTSSIVVLEGDYISNSNSIACGAYINKYNYLKERATDVLSDVAGGSKLSLMRFNNQQQHLISDRLIEYLTGNVISNMDDNSYNIGRAQTNIFKDGIKGTYGVWDYNIMNQIYNIINEKSKNNRRPIDIIGDGVTYYPDTGSSESKEIKLDNYYKTIDKYYDLLCYVDKDIEDEIDR